MRDKAQFHISRHVHCCVADGELVLLDLNADEYLSLPRHEVSALRSFVNGFHCLHEEAESVADAEPSPAQRELLESMLRSRLITDQVSERNTVVPTRATKPTTPLNRTAVEVRLWDVYRFAVATCRASGNLRWRPIARVVANVASRKARCSRGSSISLKRLEHEITLFEKLRPIYPRDYLCLFDSLALLEFLALAGVFPDWVFGVQMGPFSAHCWLQANEIVLNDQIERVGQYEPIMVV